MEMEKNAVMVLDAPFRSKISTINFSIVSTILPKGTKTRSNPIPNLEINLAICVNNSMSIPCLVPFS